MIRTFYAWWKQQMLGLVPARFASPALADAILASPDRHDPQSPDLQSPGAVLLSVRRGGEEQPAGRHEPGQAILPHLLDEHRGLPLLLRLPPDRMLKRDVSLPLAAEAGYERVLQYEMDRLTPFAADDVFWSARPLRRNKESGRLDLRLFLVPRSWVAAPLQTLAEAGGRLSGLEIRRQDGSETPLQIAVAHAPGRERVRQRRLLVAAALGCAALALLAVILPFLLQAAAASRIDQRIAALQPQIREVDALRARIRASTAGTDTIAAARAHLGDPLGLLAALTRDLPDDTYLTDLTLRDGVVTVTGQSSGAVRLIATLSADPALVAPAFSAPVTRIESNNSDLFSIRAQVAPLVAPPLVAAALAASP